MDTTTSSSSSPPLGLSINESFSYSWLTSKKPPSGSAADGDDAPCDGSFIEMDPDFFSMRWSADSKHFDLDLREPRLQYEPTIVSASCVTLPPHDHRIYPSKYDPPNHLPPFDPVLTRSQSACSTKPLISHRPVSSHSSPLFHSAQSTPSSASSSCAAKRRCGNEARGARPQKHLFFRSCTKSPKKILWKYLCFLLPLYKKAKEFGAFTANSKPSARSSCSPASKKVSSFSSIDWCRGNADSAVYDAILYCKRSIGQDI